MARPEMAVDWERLGDLSQRREQLRSAVDRLYEEWAALEDGGQPSPRLAPLDPPNLSLP